MKKICIIDYGLGNLASVYHALYNLNTSVKISSLHNDIIDSSHLILPGVGNFKAGVEGLEEKELIPLINNEVLIKKKPILGICLGMQLFCNFSEENKEKRGLNLIEANLLKISNKNREFKVPHIGWNEVEFLEKSILFKKIKKNSSFYFVHSYHLIPNDYSIVNGTCFHGEKIVVSIEKNNIYGTQFHPEKSGDAGTQLLANFLEI
jgi:glutamine amidotransferase